MKKETVKTEKEAPEKEKSIEELFGELDGIIETLTDGNILLEDSFKQYETGMRLVKSCNDKIDKVEKQIIVLNEGNT